MPTCQNYTIESLVGGEFWLGGGKFWLGGGEFWLGGGGGILVRRGGDLWLEGEDSARLGGEEKLKFQPPSDDCMSLTWVGETC